MTRERLDGPIERSRFPDKLAARVVSPGYPARLHGYAIEEDLARHYGFTEILYLALVGRLPSETQARLFDLALAFSSITTIAEAPAHAASLLRLCGSSSSAIAATGALGLAEQARHVVERHGALFSWLEDPSAERPEFPCRPDATDAQRSKALDDALAAHGLPPLPRLPSACWMVPVLALFSRAGLEATWQIETALVIGRLGVVRAEAEAVTPRDVRAYPMNLPAFTYVGDPP